MLGRVPQIFRVLHGASQGMAASPRCDAMASPTGPRLEGEGRDGTSQSPRMVAGTGTCPRESVDWHIRQCRSQVVKGGDKSRAYCY